MLSTKQRRCGWTFASMERMKEAGARRLTPPSYSGHPRRRIISSARTHFADAEKPMRGIHLCKPNVLG